MDDIDYEEVVTLVRERGEKQDMSLAEAIRTVMSWPDKLDRMKVMILRDSEPIQDSSEVEAIFNRPDFPISK